MVNASVCSKILHHPSAWEQFHCPLLLIVQEKKIDLKYFNLFQAAVITWLVNFQCENTVYSIHSVGLT